MTLIVENIIWLDIETVPLWSSEEEAISSNPDLYEVFKKKYCKDKSEEMSDWDRFRDRSALFPEFGRIVCISIGREKADDKEEKITFSMSSFAEYDEKILLQKFADLLFHPSLKDYRLGGHNIKGFDLSYIIKRLMINDIKVPPLLNILGKKPREITHIDTLELRQFGRGVSTGLELLCISLGIPTPKDDISGADVKNLFYSEVCPPPNHPYHHLERIVTYCEKDIKASYEVHKKIMSYL